MSNRSGDSRSKTPHSHSLANLDIFKPATLRTETDVERAVNILEGVLNDKSIRTILQLSLQHENYAVFELILSGVSGDHATRISKFIFEHFPSDIKRFYDSIAFKAISTLARTFQDLSFISCEKPDGLDDHLRHAKLALTALDELSKPWKGEAESHVESFDALGFQFPKTRQAAVGTVQKLLETEMRVLRFFLKKIRVSDIKGLIRQAHFDLVDFQSSSTSERPDATPINADLRFESATGFGKWRLLCSHACLRFLACDNEQSRLALEKLQELSFGNFSETNQERITRNSPVDIFRARLLGDLRIIYHVDVVEEYGAKDPSQILRILGVYHLSEMRRINWRAIAAHLARQGKEYTKRCRERTPFQGRYIDPITFDAGAQVEDSEVSSIPAASRRDADDIRSLIDLERFSIFSQNVLLNLSQPDGDRSPIIQLSLEEKKVVEGTTSTVILGRSGTGKTTVIVYKMFGIERAWLNRGSVGPRPRQMYLTKSPLLAEKVEEEYLALWLSLGVGSDLPEYVREHHQRWSTRKKINAFTAVNLGGMRDDLPRKFSELRQKHFPLFITTDTLCGLLEEDVKPGTEPESRKLYFQRKKPWNSHTQLVTSDVFKREYWPHFNEGLTKGIAPSLAFGAFLGIIKGSEESLTYPNRTLTRAAYESHENSHADYLLFESYQKRKRERGDHDHADRVHALLEIKKTQTLGEKMVDFIYVDEVQDMLMIDALLVVPLCKNPKGFMWAGDTAQTISVESVFTFEQLGALIYRYYESTQEFKQIPSQPERHQLLMNYRSHGGIVNCANAILDLLQRFPGAIDVLRPEAVSVGMELPMFFHNDLLPHNVYDFFCAQPGILAELGSRQCIIVRDELARKSFKDKIGNVGIVLTLLDSKGLEFDDVILYNFFDESTKANTWRHLTDVMTTTLGDTRHVPLIHELKYLYVAITRAKKRLWIVDYCDLDQPLMRHLLDKGLVDSPSPTCNSIRCFYKKSNSGDWLAMGKKLMLHQEFEEARIAFSRAEDPILAAVAAACSLRQLAYNTLETRQRRDAFLRSAIAFVGCAKEAEDIDDQHEYHAAAAESYAQAECHQEAIRSFTMAERYTEAVLHCFQHGLLSRAVTIIKKYIPYIDPEAIECVRDATCPEYLKKKRLGDASLFFNDDDEMMAFAIKHDITEALAPIFERQGKYKDSIIQHLRDGHALEALHAILEHVTKIRWHRSMFNTVTEGFLWRYLSFSRRAWPERAEIPVNKVHTMLDAISTQSLEDRERDAIKVFKLVLQPQSSPAFQKSLFGILLRGNLDRTIKLFALDCLFDDISIIVQASPKSKAISILDLFQQYSLMLTEVAMDSSPWETSWLRALFQFKKDGMRITVQPGTFLFDGMQTTAAARYSGGPMLLGDFVRYKKRVLLDRLSIRTSEEERIFTGLARFNPFARSFPNKKPVGDHSGSRREDENWFNERIRVYLKQIMIRDNLYRVNSNSVSMKDQRRLLHGLEHALNPPNSLCDSISTLDGDLIPEARDAFSVAKRWAHKALSTGHRTDPTSQRVVLAASCLTMSFEDNWERTLHLEHLRSAVTTMTRIFGLLLDPLGPRAPWDGNSL